MKKAQLLIVLFSFTVCVSAQKFTSTFNDMDATVGNGSWSLDLYQHPARFLEVGGLGLADDGGGLISPTFGPLDYKLGYADWGVYTTTTFHTNIFPNPNYNPDRPIGPFNPGPAFITNITSRTTTETVQVPFLTLVGAVGSSYDPWRVTVYDASGGSAYWDVTPVAIPGRFSGYAINGTNLIGNLDWTAINRFSVAGPGGDDEFHAAFRSFVIAVPEPGEYAAIGGLSLLAFALWRRARQNSHSGKYLSSL